MIEQSRRVDSGALRTVRDLVAAAGAVGDHDRLGRARAWRAAGVSSAICIETS